MVGQPDVRQRNFRVAMYLIGWIALLALASLIVILARN